MDKIRFMDSEGAFGGLYIFPIVNCLFENKMETGVRVNVDSHSIERQFLFHLCKSEDLQFILIINKFHQDCVVKRLLFSRLVL